MAEGDLNADRTRAQRLKPDLDKRDIVIAALAARLGGDVTVTAEELEEFGGSHGTEMMMWEDLPSLAVHVRVSWPARVISGDVVRGSVVRALET